MIFITNQNEREVEFGSVVKKMDEDLKILLVKLNVAEDPQDFYRQYCRMHVESFGVKFEG